MKKFWISLCFLVALSNADWAKNDDYEDDYWQNDYNDQWYQDELNKLNGEINYLDAKPNKVNEKDISANDGAHNDDYQIEDNRYVSDEKDQEKQNDFVEENMAASFSDESNSQDITVNKNDDVIKDTLFNQNQKFDDPENESQDFDQDSENNNNNQDLPVVPNIDQNIKETQDLLKSEESKIEDSEIQSQEIIQENDDQDTILSAEEENKNNLKPIENVVVDLSDENVKHDDNVSQVDDTLDETDGELEEIVDDVERISEEMVNNVDNISENLNKQEYKPDDVDTFQEEEDEDDETFADPKDTNEDSLDLNKSNVHENNFLDSIESNENLKKDSNPIDVFQNIQDNENDDDIDKSDGDDDKTIEDIYNNLNEDLDKLLDTLQRLSNDVSENQNVTEKPKDKNEVLDYEEKYNRPFREGVVLQMRQNDDYDFDENSSESKESLNDDTNINDIEENSQQVSFEKNAIDVGEKEKNIQSDNAQNLHEQSENDDTSPEVSVELSKPETETKLSDDDVQKLMNQFVLYHSAELDTENENFDRDVAAVNLQIDYEDPLTLCSPNYPGAYPANNIIDWMFDGDGMGIELNITDFALNGVLGDFLLVKPGGIDATDNDGLVFAYTLNSERNYRFMDVDRMFIRFHTHQGLNMFRGFCLSIKLMGPIPVPPEPLPIPEPSVPAVQDRHTVYFGSMRPVEFLEIREDFRLIIANMAELYVNTHDIPAGEMAINEVANITSVSVCNVNWPDYENCVAVTFGVPLKYDEDTSLEYRFNEQDLKMMWDAYSTRDPFATLIRRLGLTEFSSPNDGLMLILWLLIGCGILLVLVLFTLTLWKWNFFQDYTRMGSYSDTDSITSHKKKDPALFPTPYQDLPALYSDQDHYKFAPDFPAGDDSTRVDMGGYTNRTFTGDRMYDFDSDDEVNRTTTRGERYTTDV